MARDMCFPKGTEPIQELLGLLLGRAVSCEPCSQLSPRSQELCVRGIYVFDDDTIAALVLADLPFAAAAGAALSMLSGTSAEEVLKSGQLSSLLQENLHEVLNVSSSWFNGPYRPHVTFREQVIASSALCAEAEEVLVDYGRRLDLRVEVSGYPSGRLSILEAA